MANTGRKLGTLPHREYGAVEDAEILSEALADQLRQPVTVAQMVAQTGIPFDHAEEALNYLAVRNNATVTWMGDHNAYIFKTAHATIQGRMPSFLRSFFRYAGDVFAGQMAFIMQAVAAVGPAFVGAALFLRADSWVEWLAAGTIAMAAGGVMFQSLIRSASVLLPVALTAGIAYGLMGDQLGSGDVFWIPLAIVAAIGMQATTIFAFRSNRPQDSLRMLFWGRGFSEPMRDEQRLMELIAAKNGRVTVRDLMRTFGWSSEECSEMLAELLIEYGGDIAVDSGGHLHLQFDELGKVKTESKAMPAPAYKVEKEPPGPFQGLNVGWVMLIALACVVGALVSPLNPAYVEFVKEIDFTLTGIGIYIRQALAMLFLIPLSVYLVRLVQNIAELGAFEERREFLDALEFAEKNADGCRIGVDWYSDEVLADLNAQIHVERSEPGTLYVTFPDLQTPSPDATMDDIFFAFPDEQDTADTAEYESEAHTHAHVQRKR